jgi:hypothetical protein
MSINEHLSRLYDEWGKEHKWKKEYPGEQLKRHGLVDENTYTSTSTKPRIVLLGKELNCHENPDFDLRKVQEASKAGWFVGVWNIEWVPGL